MEHGIPGRRPPAFRLRPHGVRAGLLRRLLRGLAGDAGAAFAADGGDQRDLQRDHRRRPDRRRARRCSTSPKAMGFLAVALASVNIFGGFIVTQRMLQMFKKKK